MNQLFAEITGVARVDDGEKKEVYFALKSHPREATWKLNNKPYSSVLKDAMGASFISIIISSDGTGFVSRRYNSNKFQESVYSVTESFMYSDRTEYEPLSISLENMRLLTSIDDIYSAAKSQKKIFGRMTYKVRDRLVEVDFPVGLVNISPVAGDGGELVWQAVSDEAPFLIDGDDGVAIKVGYIAAQGFSGDYEMLYLCSNELYSIVGSDFTCLHSIKADLQLWIKIY